MFTNLNNIYSHLNINKNLILKLFLAFLFALIIFILSRNIQLWPHLWGSLSIPPNHVPFSDFKAHLLFYNCTEIGIDINTQECIYIPDGNAKFTTHPKIWVKLFGLFRLDNLLIYNFSILLILTIYFFIIFQLWENFKSSSNRIFLLIFIFSTSNFLLLERLATDIIIFLLAYLALNIRTKLFQSIFIFLGIILKYYPIFLASLLIEKKKILFFSLIFYLFFLYTFYLEEMNSLNDNMVEMALFTAYGSRTMLKAFYHLSEEYNFFLNDSNLGFFRILIVIFFFLYVFVLIIFGYIYGKENSNYLFTKFERYFLGGASIYVGSFIIGSNADYRLIFLIFTVPFIINLNIKYLKYILIFCYIFSINSFLFQSGHFLSWEFFMKAFFIFSCKFIILSLLSFLIGLLMKKISFFNFKSKKLINV